MAQIDKLFRILKERKGSDLHISVGAPPLIRVSGDLTPLSNNILPPAETKKLLYEIMSPYQQERFEKNMEMDFAYGLEGIGRFRANILLQNRGIAGVFRIIPEKILSIEELKSPQQLYNFVTEAKKFHEKIEGSALLEDFDTSGFARPGSCCYLHLLFVLERIHLRLFLDVQGDNSVSTSVSFKDFKLGSAEKFHNGHIPGDFRARDYFYLSGAEVYAGRTDSRCS